MRRRSRIHRVLKWVGAVGCMLILSSWPISNHWKIDCLLVAWLRLEDGQFRVYLPYNGSNRFGPVSISETMGRPSAQLALPDVTADHLVVYVPGVEFISSKCVVIPLWTVLLILTVPTFLLWWLDRRGYPPGHCQHCGYDLTGNVSGRCPECGTAT